MGKCEKWTIAYRPRVNQATLIDNTNAPFRKITNSWRYWRADPFLIEHEGKTWLFAELYDRIKRKGVLGCRELIGGKWRIILDEPFHLSYPFVFEHNGAYYMIPESFKSGKILLYKANSFPYSWELVQQLKEMSAVDSTLLQTPSGQYLLTVHVVNSIGTLTLVPIANDGSLQPACTVSTPQDCNCRPAGKAFIKNGMLIRPAQDCSKGYGYGLNFTHITKISNNHFEETLLLKVLPKDIRICRVSNPQGIHTYNCSSQYEVIDYKQYEFGLISKIGGLIQRVKGNNHD